MTPRKIEDEDLSSASSDVQPPLESESEDVSRRPSKRRRIFVDSDEEPQPHLTYHVPSRIQKAAAKHDAIIVQEARNSPVATSTSFQSLGLAPWLVHALTVMEIKHPTPIQKTCIPEILKGRDCIGGSQTGTGKTVAFAVPILQQWAEDPFGIYAVVLTPTRELALQIYEQLQVLGAPQSLKVVLITGGSEMRPQAVALAQRPHIVVATPGRLADHIQTSGHDTVLGLSRAKVVVLDEADRLLASGPGSMLSDVETCLSALPPSKLRQTLLFTATVTPEVRALKELPRPPGRPPIFVSEIANQSSPMATPGPLLVAHLQQTYLQVPASHKTAYLHVALSTTSLSMPPSIIVFTNRTSTTALLHRTLLHLEHSCTTLHSRLPQSVRNESLANFRAHKARILIATDVAARGLDLPSCQVVINYDVPRDPTDYVHRVGRTARAGRKGTSVTFVGARDVALVLEIEREVGRQMVEWSEEGVNLDTRVAKGRVLKDVGEARIRAQQELERVEERKMRKKRPPQASV